MPQRMRSKILQASCHSAVIIDYFQMACHITPLLPLLRFDMPRRYSRRYYTYYAAATIY